MRALRFYAAKDLRVEDVPPPVDPGPDQVVVQNRFCGICGTDLHEYAYGPIFIPTKPHPYTKAIAPRSWGMNLAGWSKRWVRMSATSRSGTACRYNP